MKLPRMPATCWKRTGGCSMLSSTRVTISTGCRSSAAQWRSRVWRTGALTPCERWFWRNTRLRLCPASSLTCRSTSESESAVRQPCWRKRLLAWARRSSTSAPGPIRDRRGPGIHSLFVGPRKEKEEDKRDRSENDQNREDPDHPKGAVTPGGSFPGRTFLD